MLYTLKDKEYEYEIDVDKLIPPIANILGFYANVPYCYVTDDKGRRKIEHNFGETHGKTAKEASDRMETLVKKWLEKHTP